MELAILLGVLTLLLVCGVPVAFSLLGATLVTFFFMDLPAIGVFQRMAGGMSVFSLMAIPFFVFAGELMHRSGIAERLVRVAEAAFGQARGGLGQVDVGASMLFGAVSGSAIASVSAMGSTTKRGRPSSWRLLATFPSINPAHFFVRSCIRNSVIFRLHSRNRLTQCAYEVRPGESINREASGLTPRNSV